MRAYLEKKRLARRVGSGAPARKCEFCKKSFVPHKYGVGRFCKKSCWYEWRKVQRATVVCGVCKKPFTVYEHDKNRRQFCGNKCANAALVTERVTPPLAPTKNTRWLPLTCGKFALVDANLIDILMKRPWSYHPRSAPTCGRVGGGSRVHLHRFVMGVEDPDVKVDHRSGDTLDNRRRNLRVATVAKNCQNSIKKRRGRSSSKYKGVHFHKGPRPWQAQIHVPGQPRHLGNFAKEEDAAIAYDAAARKWFGEFACVNFPRAGERCAI